MLQNPKTSFYQKSLNQRFFFIIFAIIFLIFIDFFSKYFFHWPFQKIVFGNDNENLYSYFPIFWDFFGIELIYNQGIAFGLPITGIFLKIITFAIIAILWYYYTKYEKPKKNLIIDTAFVFVFAGAISHTYERIFIGHVIDFLAVKNFAIFNFADICITIGGILLVSYSLFYERK